MAYIVPALAIELSTAAPSAQFLVFIKRTSNGISRATLSKAEIETLSLDPDVVLIELSVPHHLC